METVDPKSRALYPQLSPSAPGWRLLFVKQSCKKQVIHKRWKVWDTSASIHRILSAWSCYGLDVKWPLQAPVLAVLFEEVLETLEVRVRWQKQITASLSLGARASGPILSPSLPPGHQEVSHFATHSWHRVHHGPMVEWANHGPMNWTNCPVSRLSGLSLSQQQKV